MKKLRLGVNIDHVATLRNARGGVHPSPVSAALLAQKSGADGITAHLREDRRHIKDEDIVAIQDSIDIPFNFEMAPTEKMLAIALAIKPHAVCLVPEKREELTTEGGLAIAEHEQKLTPIITQLKEAGIKTSLFIEPSALEISAAASIGADVVELHTGRYCDFGAGAARDAECAKLTRAAHHAHQAGLEVHAGHGLSFETVQPIAAIAEVIELNIGHFLMGASLFMGLPAALQQMRSLMDEALNDTMYKSGNKPERETGTKIEGRGGRA